MSLLPKSVPPRPMLAVSARQQDIVFPVLASYKLDGIRALFSNGVLYSRSGLPIPNESIQWWARQSLPEGSCFDGELVVEQHIDADTSCSSFIYSQAARKIYLSEFHPTQSAIMSRAGEPNFFYAVFDQWRVPAAGGTKVPARGRLCATGGYGTPSCIHRLLYLPQVYLRNEQQLASFVQEAADRNFEGICTRHADSLYVPRRATLKSGALCKLKPFATAEATILLIHPRQHNTNPRIDSPFGLSKRRNTLGAKEELEQVGSIVVQDCETQEIFSIGTFRMTHAELQELWHNRASYINKLCTYRYLPHGEKDLPRNASMLGIRDTRDI